MKRKYIVSTGIGDFETWATSESKAINNIKWRLFGSARTTVTACWKARRCD